MLTNYVPNEKVLKCIEERDFPALREYIGTIIYTDRAFLHGEFEAAIRYLTEECYLTEIFEKFNENPPLKSKSGTMHYKVEDFTAAVYELKNNFCRERIEDVKTIGKDLYYFEQRKAEENAKMAGEEQQEQPKQTSFFGKLFGKR